MPPIRLPEFPRPNHHYSHRNIDGSGGFLRFCAPDPRKYAQNTSISAEKRCPTEIRVVLITKSAGIVERGRKNRAPRKSTQFFRHLCRVSPYKIPPAPEIQMEHLFKAKMDGPRTKIHPNHGEHPILATILRVKENQEFRYIEKIRGILDFLPGSGAGNRENTASCA